MGNDVRAGPAQAHVNCIARPVSSGPAGLCRASSPEGRGFESRPRYLEIAPTAIWRSVCVKGGGKLECAVRLVIGGGDVEGLEDLCEFIGGCWLQRVS
jgi:hypothetical protein